MAKKKRMKQAFTAAPKEGTKKSFGHKMGGLFGVTPKKSEPDSPPPTRALLRSQKSRRMKRLDGKLI